MGLTYDEFIVVLDVKKFPSERTGYTPPSGKYEVTDFIRTLEFLLPCFVKVSISIDDIRLKSNLKINQTFLVTKNHFSVQY